MNRSFHETTLTLAYPSLPQRNPEMFGWDQSVFLSTTARTANFGGGDVNGQVMLLTIAVPEPSTLGLLGIAGVAIGMVATRRRHHLP